MSTRTANLPIERSYLLKAWLVVAAIVVAAAIVIVLGVVKTSEATKSGGVPGIAKVVDYGPPKVSHEPIIVNGNPCQQCR